MRRKFCFFHTTQESVKHWLSSQRATTPATSSLCYPRVDFQLLNYITLESGPCPCDTGRRIKEGEEWGMLRILENLPSRLAPTFPQCCLTLFLRRHEQMSIHPRKRTDNELKIGYHKNPSWGTSELYWGSLQEYGCGVIHRNRNGSKML